MNWNSEETIFQVVINHEEQYSIWPKNKALPTGWVAVGPFGKKEICLNYIEKEWTDMRPLSLRKQMEHDAGLIDQS